MSWQGLLLKAMSKLPEGKEGIKTQLMSKSLMDMFEKFVDTGPTKGTKQAINAINEIESDLRKVGKVISRVDYLKEMIDNGIIDRKELSGSLKRLWGIKDKLIEIRSHHAGTSSMKTNWRTLLIDLTEGEYNIKTPAQKKILLQRLSDGLRSDATSREHRNELRSKTYRHLIDDLIEFGFHQTVYTVKTDNDEAMNHFNSNANEGKYKEGTYNWYRFAPHSTNKQKVMKDEIERFEEHHPSISDISIKLKNSPITEIFRLSSHSEEVEGKIQRRTSAKKYKMENLTAEKDKDFLIHVLELEEKFLKLNPFNLETLRNFKIAGIIRTKGDNKIDFLHNYVDLLYDISMDFTKAEEKIASILEELEDMSLSAAHYKTDLAWEYAKKIYKGGNSEIENVTDYKRLFSETERKDIETEMEGSDFLKDRKNQWKRLRMEDQFIEKDGEYTLSPAAKIAFKPIMDRGIEEGILDEIDGPFDERHKKDIEKLFTYESDEDEDEDEDEERDRLEWEKLAQGAKKNLSGIPFDESKFSTSLEKKLAGIIYHLLAQNKPVKETLTGKTSEVFKFFKMIYNTLKGFDVDGIKTLDELLDAMKGGDFDFNNPPYVDEIKRLSKVLLSNISRIKNLFGDRIIEPAIKAVIAHPYEYQEETIQKLIEKNIISEVEE